MILKNTPALYAEYSLVMDCETFDKIVIDRIFAELNDIDAGALQRHVAHCSRCRGIESGLRATREVISLSAPEVPADFVDQVLSLERSARTRLPIQQRLGRAVSVLSGYAMRPQLTMGALLLLMIGSSLFLLRTRPGDRELVQVTERGVPEGEVDSPSTMTPRLDVTPAPSSLGPSVKDSGAQRTDVATTPTTTPNSDGASSLLVSARDAFRQGNYAEAHELSERVIQLGGAETPQAALLSASALARDAGCAQALARFEALRSRYGRTAIGDEAAWNAAECHQSLGRFDRAKQLYEELRTSSAWGHRARERLRGEAPAVSSDPSNQVVPEVTP